MPLAHRPAPPAVRQHELNDVDRGLAQRLYGRGEAAAQAFGEHVLAASGQAEAVVSTVRADDLHDMSSLGSVREHRGLAPFYCSVSSSPGSVACCRSIIRMTAVQASTPYTLPLPSMASPRSAA